MPYSSASNVASYCKNLLGEEYEFTYTTTPNIDQVNFWLSSGCSIIESCLNDNGYVTPVSASSAAYLWIQEIESLFAAARAEMSRTNVVLGPGERSRGQVFEEMFWDELDRLCKRDLTRNGVAKATSGKIHVGGISRARKTVVEQDGDRVQPRFERNQFRFPDTIDPGGRDSSAS